MPEAHYAIIALNIFLWLGCGWPLTLFFTRMIGKSARMFHIIAILFIIYLIECVAISVSMGTSIFSIGLALLWGFGYGWSFYRTSIENRKLIKVALFFSIYSGLPAASLLSIPIVAALGGWSILSTEWGARFGIPDFAPWPLDTILGFFVAVALVTVILKVTITTGLACLILQTKKGSSSD